MTTLISGGTVVTTTGAGPADVLIDGETIAALLAPGAAAASGIAADNAANIAGKVTAIFLQPVHGIACKTKSLGSLLHLA